MHNEPLLQDNKDRFVIFPVKHHDIWDHYNQLKQLFSKPFPEDVLRKEHEDWQNLGSSEKRFLPYLLNYFSATTNRMSREQTLPLLSAIKIPEAAAFLQLQLSLENRQSEAAAENAGRLNRESTENFQAALQKQEKWLESFQNFSFAEKLVAASVSKIMFSADLFLLKDELEKRKILPQFCNFLGRISDEILFLSDFYRFLHDRHVLQQVSKDCMNEIVSEVLLLEKQISAELPVTGVFGITPERKDAYLNHLAEKFIFKKLKAATTNPEEQEKFNLAEKRAGTLAKKGHARGQEENPRTAQ